MTDDNKAVGPLAAAKLVALIKSALNGKLDKTGGTIFGDLKVKTNAEGTGNIDVDGEIRVKSGTAHLRDVHATGTVHSDLMAEAPLLNLRAPLAEKSVQVTQDGDTAVKMECFDGALSKGYARLEVGTPTGDNDAATKAYVDIKVKKDFVVNITFNTAAPPSIIDDRKIAVFSASTDKSFAEISSAVAAGKNVYGVCNGEKWPLYISSSTEHAFRGSVQLDRVFGSVGLAIANCIVMQNVCTVEVSAGELPAPALNGSDNGKVPTVNGTRWEMKKAAVDDALSDTSTNPVQNKVVKAALDGKASTAVATQTANGLMSAEDKTKLDSIDSVCYDIYAKIGAAYTHDSVYKYGCTVSHTFAEINTAVHAGKTPRVLLVDNIENPSDTRIICPLSEYDTSRSEGGYYFEAPGLVGVSGSGRIYIDENGAMYTCSAGELPAVDANQDGKYLTIDGGMWTYRRPDVATTAEPGFMSAKDKSKLDGVEDGANKTVVDAALDDNSTNPVQNKVVKAALDGKASTEVASQTANGLMSNDDKKKLDGVDDGANKTTVDAELDSASENPVQNKAVKAALDSKLSTRGGEISGHLRVGLTVSAEGSVSTGRTSTDTGIHFEKAGSDVGRISHGSDPMTGVSPIARLKVASPTEDDDAATKAYVDNNAAGAGAVRYDAAQTLDEAQQFQARKNIGAVGNDSPQFKGFLSLAPANAPLGTGVGLSTTRDGNNFALDISDVNEGTPALLTGVKTPTDADTNAAATVEYVLGKALPAVTTADNGKILKVVNGAWQAVYPD